MCVKKKTLLKLYFALALLGMTCWRKPVVRVCLLPRGMARLLLRGLRYVVTLVRPEKHLGSVYGWSDM